MQIKIVGMDPSLSNWGIAHALVDINTLAVTITGLDLIKTEPEKDKRIKKLVRKNHQDIERAKLLHTGMMNACRGASLAIAEVPHGSQSARAMASYGICVGILAAVPIPLIEATEAEVKLAAVGHKQAAKEEMIEWAMSRHPDAPWIMRSVRGELTPIAANEHLADAVASIYAGLQSAQFLESVALMRSMQKAAA